MPDLAAAIEEIHDVISRLQGIGQVQSSTCKDPSAAYRTQSQKHSELRSCAGGNSSRNSELPEADAITPPPTGEETIQYLHTMFEEMQILFGNFSELLPQLENTDLNPTERLRLRGSGVRRYGFIEKVFEVSGDFPQFWPPFGEGRKDMDQYVKEIDVLRNLLIWFRYVARVVQDLLLIAGDNAFRVASSYYAFTREGARRKNPEAAQVFQMLQLFWKRPRRANGEPTMLEVERDARALMRGKKDGEVSVRNESDRVIKGKKVVIDNTYRKPRGGRVVDRSTGRVVERGEVE